MASFVFNEFKRANAAGEIPLGSGDIRVALVMTNTTADTENDGIAFVGDLTTLDECDGANYVRKTLASKTVTKDDANDRMIFDATDLVFTALGNGTRQIQGALVFFHDTNDAASIPIAFIEFAAPVNPAGGDFGVNWNATTGILTLT
jgi:hypothetical protein